MSNCALNIIPLPVELEMLSGNFELRADTNLRKKDSDPRISRILDYLRDELSRATNFNFNSNEASSKGSSNAICLELNETEDKTLGDEGYNLVVESEKIILQANKEAGLFYGVQTLLQLLPAEINSPTVVEGVDWTIPCLKITDFPRFHWRGLLLDVSRHFFTVDEVKRYIDDMSRYKLNIFQWHLTDDQGWRIEIKSHPELTDIGAWRVPRGGQGNWWKHDPPQPGEKATYGGYYTQDEIREIVAYAKERQIEIVPEIDVPGHSMAILAAKPELSCTGGPFQVNPGCKFYSEVENSLCAGNEKVFQFLDDVYSEISELFPFEYIHMGGDEAYKGFWEKCPKCQIRKEEENLSDENELQSYFVKRVEKILEDKNRKLIGWDEIMEGGLSPNATVMFWRGMDGGRGCKGAIEAATMGHQVIMTPISHCYFDVYQGEKLVEPATYRLNRLSTCYDFDPGPKEIKPDLLLGIQGCLWSEEVLEFKYAQYMTWPRGMAIAENGWTPKHLKDWSNFAARVEKQFKSLDHAKTNYAVSIFDTVFNQYFDEEKNLFVELSTELDGISIHYTFEDKIPDGDSPKFEKALPVPENASELRVVSYRDGVKIGKQINMPIEELRERAAKDPN